MRTLVRVSPGIFGEYRRDPTCTTNANSDCNRPLAVVSVDTSSMPR